MLRESKELIYGYKIKRWPIFQPNLNITLLKSQALKVILYHLYILEVRGTSSSATLPQSLFMYFYLQYLGKPILYKEVYVLFIFMLLWHCLYSYWPTFSHRNVISSQYFSYTIKSILVVNLFEVHLQRDHF